MVSGFGLDYFKLALQNSIVAANTANTSTASDIYGTLAISAVSSANLIGTGGAALDWFFARLSGTTKDKLTNVLAGEVVTGL